MKKVDATVQRETLYILSWVLVLSVLLQAVFLVLRQWDITVLLGNALSGAAAVLNFFFMGLTVQKALEKDEKDAKTAMKLSQTYRMLFLIVVAAVGATFLNLWAAVIPLFFPRIAISLRPLFDKKAE
ncbi:MAG: hypothetical protein IJA11_07105 [Oscillospiraceae bacterium]|nr:hypothetical protein [Oscillospiraceae bacterium]